jgi:peptide deformylase
MAVRDIVLLGDPILREKAREVRVFDESLEDLVKDMFHTMVFAEGAGLAAPQIGVPLRVFVADTSRGEEGQGERHAVVNPTIVELAGEEERESEGCLSVPGVSEVVARPGRVVIEGFDPTGAPIRLDAEGLLGRVFQHEVDHLDGVLFFDRISPLKRGLLLKKYKRLQEEEGA